MSNHGILEAATIHGEALEYGAKFEHKRAAPPSTNTEFHLTLLEPGGTERKRRAASASISLLLQCALVSSLLLIPLMITETLPARQLVTFLVAPPPPPPPPPPPSPSAASLRRTAMTSNIVDEHLKMPSRIPQKIQSIHEEAPPAGAGIVGGVEGGVPGGQLQGIIGGIVFSSSKALAPPKPMIPQHLRISQGVSAGRLIYRIDPKYPLVAQQARIEGTVVLSAVISKQGTIENLQLISGHPMLVQAALTAVAQWEYRPYLLNGEPVEVETTITVTFKLNN